MRIQIVAFGIQQAFWFGFEDTVAEAFTDQPP
jgi:hypothetical protein